jgi:hypothetical protein
VTGNRTLTRIMRRKTEEDKKWDVREKKIKKQHNEKLVLFIKYYWGDQIKD